MQQSFLQQLYNKHRDTGGSHATFIIVNELEDTDTELQLQQHYKIWKDKQVLGVPDDKPAAPKTQLEAPPPVTPPAEPDYPTVWGTTQLYDLLRIGCRVTLPNGRVLLGDPDHVRLLVSWRTSDDPCYPLTHGGVDAALKDAKGAK